MLAMYAWDKNFFCFVTVGFLSSRVWRDAIAVDTVDLYSPGSLSIKCVLYVFDGNKCLSNFPYARSMAKGAQCGILSLPYER